MVSVRSGERHRRSLGTAARSAAADRSSRCYRRAAVDKSTGRGGVRCGARGTLTSAFVIDRFAGGASYCRGEGEAWLASPTSEAAPTGDVHRFSWTMGGFRPTKLVARGCAGAGFRRWARPGSIWRSESVRRSLLVRGGFTRSFPTGRGRMNRELPPVRDISRRRRRHSISCEHGPVTPALEIP